MSRPGTVVVLGAGEHRDNNFPSDPNQQYVRNHMRWTIAANRFRQSLLKEAADDT